MGRIDEAFTKLKEQHNVDALAHLGFKATANQNIKYIEHSNGAEVDKLFVGQTS